MSTLKHRYALFDHTGTAIGTARTIKDAEAKAHTAIFDRGAEAVRCDDSQPGEWACTVFAEAENGMGVYPSEFRTPKDGQRAIAQLIRWRQTGEATGGSHG